MSIENPSSDDHSPIVLRPSGGATELELPIPRRQRTECGGYAQGSVGRPPGFAPFRRRSDVERAARRVANMLIGGQIDAQQSHAIIHALRLVFDSMGVTESIEAELKLRKLTEEVV